MSSYLFQPKYQTVPLSNINGNVVNVDSSNYPGGFGSMATNRQFALPDNYSNNADAANASIMSPKYFKGGSKKHSLRKKIKNIINSYRMTSKKMRNHTKRRLMSLYRRKGSKRHTRRHRGGNAVLNAPIISSQYQTLEAGTNVYNTNVKPIDAVVNPYGVNNKVGGYRYKKHRKHSNRSRIHSNSSRSTSRSSNSRSSRSHRGGCDSCTRTPQAGGQKGGVGYHQYQGNIPGTPTYSTGGILSAKDSALANPVPYAKMSNCTNCVDNYNYNTNKGYQFW